MTEILEIEKMTPGDWKRVAASLAEGRLACLPADTVYGLACLPTRAATERIFRAKGREPRKPLALVFPGIGLLNRMMPGLPAGIREALGRLLPGPVTCILPLVAPLPDVYIHSKDSVGVRIIPPPAGDLYANLPSPLALTSANVSGRPDPCAAYEIPQPIMEASDFVIDAGRCPLCIPSTVLDLRPVAAGRSPRILREGALEREEIENLLEVSVV